MSLVNDLKKFAMRGNLIDLAIGFTVGAAFSTIAKSLVNDIIMPPVGYLLGSSDFADLFWVMKPGENAAPPYATLAEAQSAGAVTINYGVFINNVLAFVVVTLVMFMIIRLINKAHDAMDADVDAPPKDDEPTNKKCPYCRSVIPFKAIKCPQCTSELEHGKPPQLSGDVQKGV